MSDTTLEFCIFFYQCVQNISTYYLDDKWVDPCHVRFQNSTHVGRDILVKCY